MINKKELLDKFNKGILSDTESDTLEAMFINDSLKIDEFDIYRNLETHYQNEDVNISLDHKIQNLISEEIQKEKAKQQRRHWFTFLPLPIKLAFPLMLLFCGFFAGKSWQNTDQNSFASVDNSLLGNVQMVNDILYHPSSSQRLTLVNNANENSKNQEQIIRVLFMSLNYDNSSNVRMAAVDALMSHSDKPMVREGLIKSIRQQESSIMIEYLTEALNIIGEKVTSGKIMIAPEGNTSDNKIKTFDKNIY